jgi:hypothetical protein
VGSVNRSSVVVTELRENTRYASITLTVTARDAEIGSRTATPRGARPLLQASIFAAEDVIAESAFEFEYEVEDIEEVVDKFKQFRSDRAERDHVASSARPTQLR